MVYGPSSDRRTVVNSMKPYTVKIQFMTDKYNGDLKQIRTLLSQEGRAHQFILDCGPKFDAFKDTL